MSRTALILAMLLVPTTLLADDEPPKDDDLYLQGDSYTHKSPPIRITRPSKSWLFVNLERLRKRIRDRRQLEAYKTLVFRLYNGPARTNMFVRVYTDPSAMPKPRSVDELAMNKIKQLRSLYVKPKVKRPKKVRVGKQVGVMFQITGTLSQQKKEHTIVMAIAYRKGDRTIAELALEATPEQAKRLTKDFKKLLKKAKF